MGKHHRGLVRRERVDEGAGQCRLYGGLAGQDLHDPFLETDVAPCLDEFLPDRAGAPLDLVEGDHEVDLVAPSAFFSRSKRTGKA